MDLGSTLIGLVLTAVWLIPFVIARKANNKRKKTLEQGMTKLASENGYTITESEICNNFILGIDKAKKGLVYFKKSDETESGIFVDLRTIARCRVQTSSHKYKDKSFEKSTIDKLALEFEYILKLQADTKIEIYNAVESAQLNSEVQYAEKWAKLVNDCMAENREPKAQQKKALV